jgi:serine/threonine protein kinase
MALASGTRLGPYEIVAPLGAGGMGEVYDARDTRLDRRVAIKVLPQEIAADPERRSRLEREAKAIAALSHPHICTLYDVGSHDNFQFLVMERLEGQTLADRLAHGPLKLQEALPCAIQIADALDRAHSRGIVHRDLKPANIMLTASGAKLLDFGLAKQRPGGAPLVDGMTKSATLTGEGVIVGTLQYMAPEQLEGKEADARTDIFAFGAILYEMASGRKAFEGKSQASLIAAILAADPPPLTQLSPVAPPALDRLVKTCLAKEPHARWSSAHDVRLQLRAIMEAPDTASAASRTGSRWRAGLGWVVAGVATVGLIALGLFLAFGRSRPPEPPLDRLSILAPEDTSLVPGQAPQISPDGRRVVFVANDRSGRSLLYVRELDRPNASSIADTDGATQPFWAPDSQRVGFFARGALRTVVISGGAPQSIARAAGPRGGSWNQDDIIVFVPNPSEGPHRVAASGGAATPLPIDSVADNPRWFPTFLPDGRHYLYLAIARNRMGASIRVGSIESPENRQLVHSSASATYAEPGFLILQRETTIVAQPFDARRLEVTGPPAPIADNPGFNATSYQGLFSVSRTGALAYAESSATSQLTWFDRAGKRLGTLGQPGDYNTSCFSPDGRRIVYDLADPATGSVDLWSLEISTETISRLTFDPSLDFYSICSPVGDEVIFASLRHGAPDLYRQSLTAPGGERLLLDTPFPKTPTDWSRDGRLVLFQSLSPNTQFDVWALPLSGEGKPYPVVATPADDRSGAFSPDGRWIAYASNESGRFEVYVQPFPPTGTKWQISRAGGIQPGWGQGKNAGREFFYVSPDRRIIAVDVNGSGNTFTVGRQRVVAETRITSFGGDTLAMPFAFTPDGQRLLVVNAVENARPISLVLNWPAVLRK